MLTGNCPCTVFPLTVNCRLPVGVGLEELMWVLKPVRKRRSVIVYSPIINPPPPPVAGAVIVMPELWPRSKEFVAVNVPPPVKVISRKEHHVNVPLLVLDTVAIDPTVLVAKPISLPDAPVMLRAPVIVRVTGDGKRI